MTKENICECFACNIPSLDTIRIQKQNGRFVAEDNEVFASLKDKLSVENATNNDCFIRIKDNVEIKRPIQIINLLDKTNSEQIESKMTIQAGENSKVTFLYCDDTLPKTDVRVNNTIDIQLEPYSHVAFYKMENVNNATEITSNLTFDLLDNANLTTFFITLNGGKLRNNISVNFNGIHAEGDINGLYLMDRQQSIETNVNVYHNTDSCRSKQLFKGILDDEAKANFLGHVLIQHNAKNNDAHQTNNNILLTDKAKVNTRPFLEIYNDDVQCSHGATTGQLDENALYYLRTRGISYKTAKMLLMNAFCQSILQKSEIPSLQEGLSVLIQRRLEGDLSQENPFKINLK